MSFPSGITFCTVTGTITVAVADGSDAGTAPDKVAAQGQVTFTPDVVDKLRSNQTSPKMLILPDPVSVLLDSNGAFSVELIATDCPDLNPLDWTYTVSFSLQAGEKVAPFSMAAPGGTTVDLADVAPIADSAGTPFLPGPAGPANTLSIGTVSTLSAGSSATASVTGASPNQTLNLGIPKGADGSNGTNGTNASLAIGTVSTLAAGSNATASITGAAPTQTLNLGIPKGADGTGAIASVSAGDGSVTVGGTASNPTVKVSAGYMPPTGEITMFGGTAAPTGYLMCDGSAVSRTTYAALFAVLGTAYGAGDGSTTFNVPNLNGGNFARGGTPGSAGGAATHAHSVPALSTPAHSHTLSDAGQAEIDYGATNSSTAVVRHVTSSAWSAASGLSGTIPSVSAGSGNRTHGAALTGSTDSGGAGSTGTDTTGTGSTLPPYVGVNYIVKT